MEYTYPDYYKQFQCIAGSCENTCCAGWAIAIDDRTLRRYKDYQGNFGNRLRNSIDWKEQSFEQIEKRCTFLNEDNLCDIYSEAGKDMLCHTCKRYPRHYEEFENLREVSLSLSCPEVARIILDNKNKVEFLTSHRESKNEEYEEFDFFLFIKLQEIRDFLLRIIQNRELPWNFRVSLILAASHDIQSRIQKGKLFQIDELLARYETEGFLRKAKEKFSDYEGCEEEGFTTGKTIYKNLDNLEVLDPKWVKKRREYEALLYESGVENYTKNRTEFCAYYKDKFYEYEQILVYFIFGYFCGAVYDGNMYDKVRFAVVNTQLIQELDIAMWIKNDKKLEFCGQVDLVHRFAREIEHSDPNLEELEVMIGYQEEYSLESLLYWVNQI